MGTVDTQAGKTKRSESRQDKTATALPPESRRLPPQPHESLGLCAARILLTSSHDPALLPQDSSSGFGVLDPRCACSLGSQGGEWKCQAPATHQNSQWGAHVTQYRCSGPLSNGRGSQCVLLGMLVFETLGIDSEAQSSGMFSVRHFVCSASRLPLQKADFPSIPNHLSSAGQGARLPMRKANMQISPMHLLIILPYKVETVAFG